MIADEKIPQKIRALRYVAEQGHVSLADLKRHLGTKAKLSSLRVSAYQFGLNCFRYGNIPHGIFYISDPDLFSLLGQYSYEFFNFKPNKVNFNAVEHALGMNSIRFALFNHPKLNIRYWMSEQFLRASPYRDRLEFSYSKIPDAIFYTEQSEGAVRRYFVEFERSLKSLDRYKKIFNYYARRDDVTKGSVLYIAPSAVKKELLKMVEKVFPKGALNTRAEIFQFIDFDELVNNQKEGERS